MQGDRNLSLEPIAQDLWNRPFGRRTLLSYAAWSASWLVLAQWRMPMGALGAPREGYTWQVFSAKEAAVLAAVMERMVRGGEPRFPPVKKTRAVETVDWSLTFASPDLQSQARWLLWVFNWSPLWVLWRPALFVNLRDEQQDACLRAWSQSSRQWMRAGFLALKNLSVLGYYSQDEVWQSIHYRGPWVPRPRRVGWVKGKEQEP